MIKSDYYIKIDYKQHSELIDSNIDISMQSIDYIRSLNKNCIFNIQTECTLNIDKSPGYLEDQTKVNELKYLQLKNNHFSDEFMQHVGHAPSSGILSTILPHTSKKSISWSIRELPDEYFLVYSQEIIPNGHFTSLLLKKSYKCDQLDGVKELLTDLKII